MTKLFKVYCVSGSVRHVVYTGSHTECVYFCREHNWVYDYNGGLVWDLEYDEA